jgi:hypothetical protein
MKTYGTMQIERADRVKPYDWPTRQYKQPKSVKRFLHLFDLFFPSQNRHDPRGI